MQIGVNGRGWVQMGAIGYKGAGGQANKASMHIYSDTAHAFRPYGREISPKKPNACGAGINVCGCMHMVKNECRWVSGQCRYGECTKQHKNMHKWARMSNIWQHTIMEKIHAICRDG